MLLTLENGLDIDLLFPEKSFYRVSNASGYYKDFETLNEAQSLIKYDFLIIILCIKLFKHLIILGK